MGWFIFAPVNDPRFHSGTSAFTAAGYIVWVEAGNNRGRHTLAAVFGEPPAGDESGWYKLVAEFEQPPLQ